MENIKLLEDVIKNRLEIAEDDVESEESKRAFKEAMEAIDKMIQLEKLEVSKLEVENKERLEREKLEVSKLEAENKERLEREKFEKSNKEQKKNDILRIVEVVAVPVGLFTLDCLFKRYYMRSVCNFEKDYTFTTTPGKSISGLFKFKK